MEGKFLCCSRVRPARQVLCGLVPVTVAAGIVGLWDVVTAALNGVLLVYLMNEELKLKERVPRLESTRAWVYWSFASIPLSIFGLMSLAVKWKRGIHIWSVGKQAYCLLYTFMSLYYSTAYCDGSDWLCAAVSITGVLLHRLGIDLYFSYVIWSTAEEMKQEDSSPAQGRQIEMSDRPLIPPN